MGISYSSETCHLFILVQSQQLYGQMHEPINLDTVHLLLWAFWLVVSILVRLLLFLQLLRIQRVQKKVIIWLINGIPYDQGKCYTQKLKRIISYKYTLSLVCIQLKRCIELYTSWWQANSFSSLYMQTSLLRWMLS